MLATAALPRSASGGPLPAQTSTPFSTPTPTARFTVTATFTALPTAEAGCQWDTFRLASDDDASWTRIDASGPTPAWPPAGGSGPIDVTGDGRITVMVQGSSDTLTQVTGFDTPPGVAWSYVMNRETHDAWTIENLAINNQSTIDYRALRLPSAPQYIIPWVETWPHEPCGTSGLESDLTACNPDVVVIVPEANDAMWPTLYPDQLDATPQDLLDALVRQCGVVLTDNPNRRCLVPTVSKAPYIATWPATSGWIDQANALIRATFPNTQVIDFTTGSSNALDYYHVPWGYEGLISHSNQRVHDVRAGRALVALMPSAFTTTAPVLQAETRLWNGVSGLSVVGMRWDTSALPDDADVRTAVVEVHSTYRGAPGAGAHTRSVGFQWATDQAADGWQADDWPTSLAATAYAGDPPIGATEERGAAWSFTLTNPRTISLTGYTGLYAFVTPATLPPVDSYFNYDMVAFDSPFGPEKVCIGALGSNAGTPCPLGTECSGGAICLAGRACVGGSNPGTPCPVGDECAGGACVASDAAPKLHVYHCLAAPAATATPTATAAPSESVTHTGTPLATPSPSAASTPTATTTASAAPSLAPTATHTEPAAPTPTGSPPATSAPTSSSTASPEPTQTSALTPTPMPCAGDCNGDELVGVDELVRGVRIALGEQMLADCRTFDRDGDQQVAIYELIGGVDNLLAGCGASHGSR